MRPPSIEECRALLDACSRRRLPALLRELEADRRAGVRELAASRRRALAAERREDARLERLMARQLALHAQGVTVVAGVDEVGRGALAGPLTVAAVVFDASTRVRGLDDSKRLTPARRQEIALVVRESAIGYAIVHVEPGEIDAIGIGVAVRAGMERAVASLEVTPDHVLVDGNDAHLRLAATAVVGGDRLCACIAAASVIAKVERDALMVALASEHPAYAFDINKGYGTAEHLDAIRLHGPSALHRRSFAPCAQPPLF